MNLHELLGIAFPVIQAPMAGSQGSALAIAVSNAGGLGSLPCAMLGPDALRAELDTLRAGTDRPYNINFFCHTPPYPTPRAKHDGARPSARTTRNSASIPPAFRPARGARRSRPRSPTWSNPTGLPWSVSISACHRRICWPV